MGKNITEEGAEKMAAALKNKGEDPASKAEEAGSRQVDNSAAGDAGDKAPEQKTVKTVEQVEKDFNDYKSGEGTRFDAERRKFLEDFATESPEHWKHVYGPDVPPPDGLFDEEVKPGKGKGKEPAKDGEEEDPRDKRLAALESEAKERKESEALEALSDRIETEMARHDEVFNGQKNPLGPQLVRSVIAEIRRNPRADLKTVVDGVAASFREYEKKAQEKYVGGKTQVAESLPAGTGKGGGVQAGGAPTEYDFSKRHGAGSMRDGLTAALRAAKGK